MHNRLLTLACILSFTAIGLLTPGANFAATAAAARTQQEILAELAEAALPKVDVAATADPSYAASFAKQRDAVRQKRAEIIIELYKAAPDTPEMPTLLAERWQTMVQREDVDAAISEMSSYLSGIASPQDKQTVAFQRAQTIIQHRAKDTPARLAAVEEFKTLAPFDIPRVMVPQLLYWTAKLDPDLKAREKRLKEIVTIYPNAPVSKVINGATRRQDAMGKTMNVAFDDAITGTPIDLKDFRGRVVVVDFWAAWCTDCAAEMPYMKKIYADYKDKGVVFIGVSLDLPEADGGLDALKRGVASHQITWPQYYLGREWDSDFSSEWGVYAVPAVFVLDRQGKVVNTDASGKLEKILPELLTAFK